MRPPSHNPILFRRGSSEFEIQRVEGGTGFVGLRNGRATATSPDAAGVARALIKADRLQR